MYVPLRVHGHHSMLTGVDAPKQLIERAAELALPALALADVDTASGVVDLARAARRIRGVRPIVGAEISDPSGLPGRVVALAKDGEGWRNLCKLVSARQLGGDPGETRARLDGPEAFRVVDEVVRRQAGLVLLVDHPRLVMEFAGRVDERALYAAISPASLALRVARGVPRNAARAANDDRRRGGVRSAGIDAFDVRRRGDEELLETPKVPAPEPPVAAQELVEVSRACDIATLAVPDTYYAHASSAADHRTRVAIKHNALAHDLPESWLASRPAHLLTAAEMRALYADLPEVPGPFARSALGAIERTLDVADACRFELDLDRLLFPQATLAPGETPYSRLAALAFRGASERYRPLKPEVVHRLEYELTTIDKLGFSGYFLLVVQIADFARAQGIPYVGRGSAADSLVAYCLRLTDADPLRYRLTFERFLNPTRKDRPDIDLDFCWRRRDEVLGHVDALFGAERTAMIATIATCGVRAAFREAALVEGVPPALANRWSRRLPLYPTGSSVAAEALGILHGGQATTSGVRTRERGTRPAPAPIALPACLADNEVAELFARTPEARGFPFDDPRIRRVLHAADRLVGVPRHYGLHPGGVVVAPGPITDFLPCQRATKGCVVTQFDKDAVEAIGLVKMDLLGNRALTTVDDCLKALARDGVQVDLDALPEDDPATARTLREGRTLGCGQIDSPGMRNLLQQIGATKMDDVIQALALMRPGPAGSGMKDEYVRRHRGLEPQHAPHEWLTELLWDTHGLMLYQEDVMHVAARVAGMDLAEADVLRRALQKRKNAEDLPALRERFVGGAIDQGIDRAQALDVWKLVENFASFGFCKAHAVTYGRIAYHAAWLKSHHPSTYLAAFLESDTGYYATRVYVEEARRLGVTILPPDVNASAKHAWHAHGARHAIRVPLGRVRGVGAATLDAIVVAREKDGRFTSLPDFLERTGAQGDEVEALIRCGAFDGFDRPIPELLWRLHLLRAPARRVPKDAALDARELAALRATPRSREDARAKDSLRAARAKTAGWSGAGIGIGNLDLAPGETTSLFGPPETGAPALPRLPDLDRAARGRLEHELLGLTVSAHPTALFPCPADARIAARDDVGGESARPVNPTSARDVPRLAGARITLRGWTAATRPVRTVDGRVMRFLTLEDETGLAEIVIFADVYERDGAHLAERGVLCVTGTVEDHMGACTLHAEVIW